MLTAADLDSIFCEPCTDRTWQGTYLDVLKSTLPIVHKLHFATNTQLPLPQSVIDAVCKICVGTWERKAKPPFFTASVTELSYNQLSVAETFYPAMFRTIVNVTIRENFSTDKAILDLIINALDQ